MRSIKWHAYWRLMRIDKPVGIYLLLWPTLWGLVVAAEGIPPLHILVIFMLGVLVMRSAGCVINDYADRKVDGAVKRTNTRPLVTGEVTSKEALLLFSLLITIAFILVLQLNIQTILLSMGALLLASIYPFMKRYTHFPQVFLGAAFSWSIPMAFMAIQQFIPWWCWLVYAANLCWTVAYDTQYAMVDRNDDVKVGIKSTALFFGHYELLAIAMLQVMTIGLLAWVFFALNVLWWVYGSLVMVCLLFVYQFTLIRRREPQKCFHAFLHNNWVGMVITIGLVLNFLWRSYLQAQ